MTDSRGNALIPLLLLWVTSGLSGPTDYNLRETIAMLFCAMDQRVIILGLDTSSLQYRVLRRDYRRQVVVASRTWANRAFSDPQFRHVLPMRVL